MSYGEIFKLNKEGDLGIIEFDVAPEAMNTWTKEAIEEFNALTGDLEKATDLKGVIFLSGKPENFHAGANLNLLTEMKDAEETAKALDVFHSMFKRLGALPYPTVAAIHGHCLGGGLEFALACSARIAKESKTTLIGLPECSLGIFPGGGGTQRLPRLIGYGAIELILKGKILPAAKAHGLGLIDLLVAPDGDLLKEAIQFTKKIAANPEIAGHQGHPRRGPGLTG